MTGKKKRKRKTKTNPYVGRPMWRCGSRGHRNRAGESKLPTRHGRGIVRPGPHGGIKEEQHNKQSSSRPLPVRLFRSGFSFFSFSFFLFLYCLFFISFIVFSSLFFLSPIYFSLFHFVFLFL